MITYADKEQARYWPVSAELMAQYNDGSNTYKNEYNSLIWLQNGQYHRDGDKPAIIYADGTLEWRKNGQYHRDGDKPAWIDANGSLKWWQNNKLHRACGPAVIYPNGRQEWRINDEDITPEVNLWLDREEWHGTPEQVFEFQLRFT